MDEYTLHTLVSNAFEIGYNKARMDMGQLKPYYSRREADKLYGTRTVQRWIDEGLIEPAQDGHNTSRMRLDRFRLETIAATSNRS